MTEQRLIQIACEECEGRGIFYFTGDESLFDSQVCGKCHGVGNHQFTEQSVKCERCGVDCFTCPCPALCESCTEQDWREYY